MTFPGENLIAVPSGEVTLAVRSLGDPDRPTVVLVHGFPDNQQMWDPVVEVLRERFHVVTYDVRGAGRSTVPSSRAGYRVERLVDDLVAVLDATAGDGRPVHLVGHDWGSVQTWESVLREGTDARLRGRIASFTTISGPALAHFGAFARRAVRQRRWGVLLGQLRRSWYIAMFQLPFLPELVFRRFGHRVRAGLTESEGLGRDAHWSQTFAEDAAHGVNLYRANVARRPEPGLPTRTSLPVQLVVPLRDAFLSPAIYADLGRYASNLTRVEVDAGHWVPRTHPEVVAGLVADVAGTP